MIQKLLLIAWIIVVLTHCTKKQLFSGNDLEVIVTDDQDNVTPQTIVKIYQSKSAYVDGTAFDSAVTDKQGTATFYEIDPRMVEIYVEASKGKAKNWGQRHTIALTAGSNRMVTKIEESRENILIGKLGRDWKQTGFVVDGISNEDCQYRRVYRFEQGGKLQIYTPEDCKWAENYFVEEVWALNFQNISIGSPTNPVAQKNGSIQILNDKKLQFFYQKKGANGTSTYVESFKAID